MKKIQIIVFIIVVVCISCKTSTLFHKNIPLRYFTCEDKGVLLKKSIVQISANNIQECFIADTTKITWILFFYYDCMQSVRNEVNLYRNYSDYFNLVVISMNYDIKNIKTEEKNLEYPIYYIPVSTDRMRINTRIFIKEIFGDNIRKDVTTSSNIFVSHKQIISWSYDITDSLLQEVIAIFNVQKQEKE